MHAWGSRWVHAHGRWAVKSGIIKRDRDNTHHWRRHVADLRQPEFDRALKSEEEDEDDSEGLPAGQCQLHSLELGLELIPLVFEILVVFGVEKALLLLLQGLVVNTVVCIHCLRVHRLQVLEQDEFPEKRKV